MEIRCGNCSKLFRVADEKITGKGIKFACTRCNNPVKITREEFETYMLSKSAVSILDSFEPKLKSAATATHEPEAAKAELRPDAGVLTVVAEPNVLAPPSSPAPDFLREKEGHLVAEPDLFGQASPPDNQQPVPETQSPAAPAFTAPSVPEPEPAIAPPIKAEPESKKEPASVPEQSRKPEPSLEPHPDPAVEAELQAKQKIQPELKPKPETAPVVEPKVSPQPQPKPEPKPERKPEPEPKPERKPEPKPEPVAKPQVAPKPKPEPVRRPTPAAAQAAPPVSSRTPKREPSRPAAERVVHEETLVEPSRTGKMGLVLLAAFILVGLAGYGVFKYMRPVTHTSRISRPEVTSIEGLRIVNASGSVEPNGDLLISGVVENTTDKERSAWYIVVDVLDAQETVLNKLKLLNGKQLFTRRDYEILAKRGVNIQDLKTKALYERGVVIPAKSSVPFEMRYIQPPLGIATFNAALQPFDPVKLYKEIEEDAR